MIILKGQYSKRPLKWVKICSVCFSGRICFGFISDQWLEFKNSFSTSSAIIRLFAPCGVLLRDPVHNANRTNHPETSSLVSSHVLIRTHKKWPICLVNYIDLFFQMARSKLILGRQNKSDVAGQKKYFNICLALINV